MEIERNDLIEERSEIRDELDALNANYGEEYATRFEEIMSSVRENKVSIYKTRAWIEEIKYDIEKYHKETDLIVLNFVNKETGQGTPIIVSPHLTLTDINIHILSPRLSYRNYNELFVPVLTHLSAYETLDQLGVKNGDKLDFYFNSIPQ